MRCCDSDELSIDEALRLMFAELLYLDLQLQNTNASSSMINCVTLIVHPTSISRDECKPDDAAIGTCGCRDNYTTNQLIYFDASLDSANVYIQTSYNFSCYYYLPSYNTVIRQSPSQYQSQSRNALY